MKYTATVTAFDTIRAGLNPRIPTNLAIASLRDNIEGVGLLEPLTVWEPPQQKGVLELIRGHRRKEAIGQILAANPKRFAELFPKGIPVLKVSDITAEEVVMLKLDHSEQRGLSDPHELQRSANMLFDIDKTEAEVAFQLSGLIDKISPMKQKSRVELESIDSKIKAAKDSGNDAAVQLMEREKRDFIAAYRRGFVQNLHNTFRCPVAVMNALYFKATGMKPEGVNEYLPNLTAADVTVLWTAHKADLGIMGENGVPKYNKQIVGPNFTEKWAKLCAKSKEAAESTDSAVAKPKAMSAKEMAAEIKEGKFKSELACKLTSHHSGDKAIDDLTLLDNAAYQSDLVRRFDKVLWETVVTVSNEIEKRLIAEAAKAATAAK